MNRIIVLQPNIANKIAAGEVVERPASVVKELVENAIDALASAITVEIKNGGLDYIRVTDNGIGIGAEDCLVAFERHATSKIESADDLQHIDTLGFRGEALSSIAAVAHVRLRTRRKADEAGMLVLVEGGQTKLSEPTGCPEGTTMEVSDLFFNVPARRKFLKAPRTEGSYVGEYLSRMILARPDISFKFIMNGKTVYHSPGDQVLKNAVYCVYGSEVLPHLKPLLLDDGYIRLTGFVGSPALTRPNRSYQSFLVNGRYIRSILLSNALQQAYDTRLMGGRYPFCVVALKISSFEVDVNVHPNKLEVRFTDEQRVMSALRRAAGLALSENSAPKLQWPALETVLAEKDALIGGEKEDLRTLNTNRSVGREKDEPLILNRPLVPLPRLNEDFGHFDLFLDKTVPPKREATIRKPEVVGEEEPPKIQKREEAPPFITPTATQSREAQAPPPPVIKIQSIAAQRQERALKNHEGEQERFGAEPYRVAGKVFDTYWIVQQGERIFFIDQHAAHERRLYEQFSTAAAQEAAQQLLLPEIVTLTPTEADALAGHEPLLRSLGFALEPFGNLTVRVTAVPLILHSSKLSDLIHQVLDLLSQEGKAKTMDLRREAVIQLACKHAVKAGDALSDSQIEGLLQDFTKAGAPMTCPHGRPVMIQMTKRELEKLFKRVL